MIIIGITGSIGMGKTTLARQFKKLGVAVCDSDALVHRLLGPKGQAVKAVAKLFPESAAGNAIDRKKLGRAVFADDAKLKKLEEILHPLVRSEQDRFIIQARKHGRHIVALDIPLLFETRAQTRCDYTVVATAPHFAQRTRVFQRMQMTEERFQKVLARQMPDREKRRRADFVVQTGLGKFAGLKEAKRILAYVKKKSAKLRA